MMPRIPGRTLGLLIVVAHLARLVAPATGRRHSSVFGWLYCFDDVQSDQPEPRPWEQQP